MSNFFCAHKIFFRTFVFCLAFLILILSFPSSAFSDSVPVFSNTVFDEQRFNSSFYAGLSVYYISSSSFSYVPTSIYFSSSFNLTNPRIGFVPNTHNSDYVALVASCDFVSDAGFYPVLRAVCSLNGSYTYNNVGGSLLYNSSYPDSFVLNSRVSSSSIDCLFLRSSVDSSLIYSSFDDFYNSAPSSNGFVLEYDLPPGNVLFARLADHDFDLIVSAQFESWSDLSSGYFNRNPFFYGFSDAVPNTSTVFPASYMAQHFLYKSGSTNLLGQSQRGSLYVSSSASEQFLVIYNPVSIHSDTGSVTSYIPEDITLHVILDSALSAYAFPLNSSFSISGGVTGSSDFSSDQEFSIDYDEDLQTWVTTDSDGNVAALPDGGYNDLSPDTSSIKGILQNFVRNFTGIFEKSYTAISNLISAGSAFISRLGGMFAWLPADVYAVLSSALLLVVVIGVLKVLL